MLVSTHPPIITPPHDPNPPPPQPLLPTTHTHQVWVEDAHPSTPLGDVPYYLSWNKEYNLPKNVLLEKVLGKDALVPGDIVPSTPSTTRMRELFSFDILRGPKRHTMVKEKPAGVLVVVAVYVLVEGVLGGSVWYTQHMYMYNAYTASKPIQIQRNTSTIGQMLYNDTDVIHKHTSHIHRC